MPLRCCSSSSSSTAPLCTSYSTQFLCILLPSLQASSLALDIRILSSTPPLSYSWQIVSRFAEHRPIIQPAYPYIIHTLPTSSSSSRESARGPQHLHAAKQIDESAAGDHRVDFSDKGPRYSIDRCMHRGKGAKGAKGRAEYKLARPGLALGRWRL